MTRAPERKLAPGVLLDRDGTLNHDKGFVWRWSDFEWLEGAHEALARLKGAGLRLAAVTNQSGVARGLYGEADVRALHDRIDLDLIDRHGFKLDGWYYCPHMPDAGCECRKPGPGMLRRAAAELGIDLSRSYMVGDKLMDYLAGTAAGVRMSVLVLTGHGEGERPKLPAGAVVAGSLAEAAGLILADLAGQDPMGRPPAL
jgi:D-glycero-D-manno-heptose 1,7-bisphosphate phosphatase